MENDEFKRVNQRSDEIVFGPIKGLHILNTFLTCLQGVEMIGIARGRWGATLWRTSHA